MLSNAKDLLDILKNYFKAVEYSVITISLNINDV